MIRLLSTLFLVAWLTSTLAGQEVLKHAHNDYAKSVPLWNALECSMHSIEIDIVRYKGQLVVSHDFDRLDQKPTIQQLYFDPLTEFLDSNDVDILLLVDLKTGDWATLNLLDSIVRLYASYFLSRGELASLQPLQIILSGDFPRDSLRRSNHFPYFFVDGRPEELESNRAKLEFTPWISTNFSTVSAWRGKGKLPRRDAIRIKSLLEQVHRHQAQLRFWNTPDLEKVWRALTRLGVDILGTDDPCRLNEFLK